MPEGWGVQKKIAVQARCAAGEVGAREEGEGKGEGGAEGPGERERERRRGRARGEKSECGRRREGGREHGGKRKESDYEGKGFW